MNYYKRLVTAVLTAVLFLSGLPVCAQETESAGPSEIHLSWTGDTGSTVTLTWKEPLEVERAYVEYRKEGTKGESTAEAEAEPQSYASQMETGLQQFAVTLEGLEAGASYTCQIKDSKGDSRDSSFTVPGSEDTVTFGYFGDVQVYQDAASEFEKWGKLAETAYENNPDMSFGLMGGDIVESGISTDQFHMFFQAAEPVFSRIPLMATNGNHESNFIGGKPELYLDEFNFPQNGPEGFKEEFYSFETGNCHVTVLNSWVFSGEQSITDEQYAEIASWIDSDLSSTDAKWKIVVMHHPIYAVASDNVSNAVKENWAPILEKDGVSLVLCGHQHVYARSLPMTGGLVDYTNGITQVMGVSGSKFYSSADETRMERTIYGTSCYQIVRITGDSLTLQSYDENGNELDSAVLTPNERKEETISFDDVSDTDWFAESVSWVVSNGIFSGISSSSFAPYDTMTRSMLTTVIWRAAGQPEPVSRSSFSDVSPDQWYTDSISWAAENGIVNGYGSDSFAPADPVTREQFVTILCRYADWSGKGMQAEGDLSRFTDRTSVSGWAEDAVKLAVGAGILSGNDRSELNPQGQTSRAEAAAMLSRFLK